MKDVNLQVKGWAVFGLLLVFAVPAKADLLRATRSGIMCTSPDALAKLSLPDGTSRTAAQNVSPAIEAIARAGDCVDFPVGNVVQLLTRRNNTSVVRSDTLSGDGILGTYYIPNIDYAPYLPPADEWNNAIRAQCAAKLEETVVLRDRMDGFVASLPKAVSGSIDKAIDDQCGGAGPCSVAQRYAEVSKRRLVQRWATYRCRQP